MAPDILSHAGYIRALLYPFGFLSAIAFGGRFLVQWIASERAKKSLSIPLFWKLSIVGNVTLMLHSIIQLHLPMCVSQALMGVLAWRNLNLLGPVEERKPIKTVYVALVITLFGSIALFYAQWIFVAGPVIWIKAPYSLGTHHHPVVIPLWVHLIGIIGMTAFSLRFWLQWWHAEKKEASIFSESFWWVSLIGAILSAAYFICMLDFVNFIGPVAAIVPNIRNLILLRRSERGMRPLTKGLLFMVAGETSASLYGAELIKKLKQKRSFEIHGCGGSDMIREGLQERASFKAFQVMGITAVLKKLPQIIIAYHKLRNAILKENPEAVILIDQPSFSLKIAKSLRKKGYAGKIVQYVAPTVWAYKKKRVQSLERDFDLLLTLFPFEKKYFNESRLQCTFCGHPIAFKIASLRAHQTKSSEKKNRMALFPGSRRAEIESNLPLQLEAIKERREEIAISIARPEYKKIIEKCLRSHNIAQERIAFIPYEDRYGLMQACDFALAKSGTVTLELGLFEVPTVVTYPLSLFNYIVAKFVFSLRLPYYCIVNILLHKEVFPECIGYGIKASTVKKAISHLSKKSADLSTDLSADLSTDLSKLPLLLNAGNDPSEIAAAAILKLL